MIFFHFHVCFSGAVLTLLLSYEMDLIPDFTQFFLAIVWTVFSGGN